MSEYDDEDFDTGSPVTCANSRRRPSVSHGQSLPGNGRLGKSSEPQRGAARGGVSAVDEEDVPPTAAGLNSSVQSQTEEQHAAQHTPPMSSSGGGGAKAPASTLNDLRAENIALRRDLLELNRKLDYHLLQQGLDLPAAIAAPRPGAMLPRQKLQLQIENRRKTNVELRHKLNAMAPLGSTAELDELRRTHAQFNQQLEKLRSDNRGLENVFAHQRSKLTVEEKQERELQEHRKGHSDKMRRMKEQIRDARSKREHESTVFQKHMRTMKRLEERLRLYEELGKEWTCVSSEEIEKRIADQTVTVTQLQTEVNASMQHNAKEQRRKRQQERHQKELKDLHKEYIRLGGSGSNSLNQSMF